MAADTAIVMLKALDGLAARATVTAQNIANGGTPGYRPYRLSFEDALARAAASDDDSVRSMPLAATRVMSIASDGRARLDLEMATASTTALRYGALVDMLGRELELQELTMTGNA